MGRIKSRLMNEEVRAWEEYALRLEQKKHADQTGFYNNAWHAVILIGILFLFACSPQKQLERLIKKHPELVKSDTTHQKIQAATHLTEADSDSVNNALKPIIIALDTTQPPIIADKPCNCNYDSAFGLYKKSLRKNIGSAVQKSSSGIQHYENSRSKISDTYYSKDGIKIHAYQDGDSLRLAVDAPKQVLTVQPIIHQGINTWWRIASILEFLIIAGLFVLLFKK